MKLFINKYIPIFTCLILILAGTAACQNNEADTTTHNATPGTTQSPTAIADIVKSMSMYYFKEPVKAPDFELSSVNDKIHSLNQYHGKTVLLSFWATW